MTDYMKPYPHPGKYEGELLLVEYLDGNPEYAYADTGDVETFGHYALYDLRDWNPEQEGGTIEGAGEAVILSTNSVGFVSATYYETWREAEQEFDKLEAAYGELISED